MERLKVSLGVSSDSSSTEANEDSTTIYGTRWASRDAPR